MCCGGCGGRGKFIIIIISSSSSSSSSSSICNHVHAGCLQFRTCNIQCLLGVQCYNYSVFANCAKCNVISHGKCFVLLLEYLPKYMFSVQYGCLPYFLGFMFSRYVAQVISE